MSRDAMDPPSESPPSASARGPRDPTVGELEGRLGVAITDAPLALAALTHKSFVNEHRGEGLQDNERLEFLGDAVIDLAVSHRLMERFPEAREGELSKIRAAVVDEAGLALIARKLDLGSLLRLGRGEELTGGRQKSSLLADALEAVMAALYIAGGLEPVLSVIDRFLGDAFARAAAGTLDRDYKTQFQEFAQSRLRAIPRYRVVAEHGPDHSKTFEVELEVRGEVIGRGAGRSKKDAEQAAAKLALGTIAGRFAEIAPESAPESTPVPESLATAVPASAPGPAPDALDGHPAAADEVVTAPEAAAPGDEPVRKPLRRKATATAACRTHSAVKLATTTRRRSAARKPTLRTRSRKPEKK